VQIRRIFLDGYNVLNVRTIFFRFIRLSSRMRKKHGINDAIKVTSFDVINYSENLYAVSIKEDTAYLCLKLYSASTKEDLYVVSIRKPYAVLDYKSCNIIEYNNRGAHAEKPQYAVLNSFNTAYQPNFRPINTKP
ncbi:hypothetical protein Tco_0068195, partial [Tanacetum coccineum]